MLSLPARFSARQVVTQDSTNILLRTLTLKKSRDRGKRPAADDSPIAASDGGRPSKRPNSRGAAGAGQEGAGKVQGGANASGAGTSAAAGAGGNAAGASRARAGGRGGGGGAAATGAAAGAAVAVIEGRRYCDAELAGLTVERLRALLRSKAASTSGTKDELIARVKRCYRAR